MFGRLLSTRLKAAETALREGRLDEAHRIAIAPDLREQRRGATLLQQLTEKLIERAREHFAADRFAEALRDLDRAETGGVLQERISALREQVQTVADEVARQERSRHHRLADARRRVAEGSLEAGRRILNAASEGDAAAAQIKREIEMRDQEASEVLAQVERLMREGQWIAAVERFTKAKGLDPHDAACVKLEAELCTQVLQNTRQLLQEGRVERAADELACLGTLGQTLPAKRELQDLLRLVRQAGEGLGRGDYDGARENTMRLQRLAPDLRWVGEVVEQLGSIDKAMTALRAGPLGAFAYALPSAPRPREEVGRPGEAALPARPGDLTETVALGAAPRAGGLPDRLLLLVDGGGSYLLLRKDRVSIGFDGRWVEE